MYIYIPLEDPCGVVPLSPFESLFESIVQADVKSIQHANVQTNMTKQDARSKKSLRY